MVTTSQGAIAQSGMEPSSAVSDQPLARLDARISAYLVDSIVLVAFVLVFLIVAGSILLFTSDGGSGNPPDSAYYASVAVFLGGSLLAWTAFNLALMRWRGQTTGMYVLGIKTVGVGAPAVTTGQALIRWFGLHPLLFHPLLLPIWGILSLLVVSLTVSQVALFITLALALLCLASPVGSLAAVLLDPERRAPHDRLAQTIVVHLDQP